MNYIDRFNRIQPTGFLSILVGLSLAIILNSFCSTDIASPGNPIPLNTQQLIVVITESFESSHASLYQYRRAGEQEDWTILGDPIPAIVGKNGLGWGIGLHTMGKESGPVKREGDGKGPAGVFGLSSVFGFAPAEEMTGLKMPYQHIVELVECVDDPNSLYYNTIIHRNQAEQIDWKSSERMWRADLWYELGVVIDHNRNPSEKNGGSCIFLHFWADPQDSTSGCTAMSPPDMRKIVQWLDESKNPVLVQLPRPIYDKYQSSWDLPSIPLQEKQSEVNIQEKMPMIPSRAVNSKTYVFNCEKGYSFTLRIEDQTAWLFLADTTIALEKGIVESGNVYQSGQYTFWYRGNNSKLLTEDGIYENCRNNPSLAIWEAAKLNGVDFRAVGNEPGWSLELTEGKNLILSTNYGRDVYQFKTPSPEINKESTQTVYRAQGEGNSLTLIIENRACNDNMDGLAFQNSVMIVINDQKLVGCGRVLH